MVIGTPTQLGYLIGDGLDDDIDPDRATFLIECANVLASTIVNPVPSGAIGTILQIAARAYIAVAGVTAETTGPTTVQLQAGLYMTRAERRTLRLMAGKGAAFSIDPTPSGAGTGLAWWDKSDGPIFPFFPYGPF